MIAPRTRWIATVVALVSSFALWTLASPIGSSPDEPQHMTYAWGLSTGQGPGGADPECTVKDLCPKTPYDVPADLIPDPTCYQTNTAESAACGTTRTSPVNTQMTRYPPPYYLTIGTALRVSMALGVSAPDAAIVGRVLSAVLTGATLLGGALVAHRQKMSAASLLPLTPMTFFLSGSINPNGLEITAAIAAAIALLVFDDPADERLRIGVWAWSSFWLAFARPLGWMWLGLLVCFGAALIVARSESPLRQTLKRHRWVAMTATAWMVLSLAWFAFALQVQPTRSLASKTLPEGTVSQLVAIGLRFGTMSTEAIGVLGWLDTPVPALLRMTILFGMFGGIVLAARSIPTTSVRRICFGYFATAAAAIGVIMWYQQFLWQGRYAIPPVAAGIAFLVVSSRGPNHHAIARLAALPMIASPFAALWLHARYSLGLVRGPRYTIPNLAIDAQWSAPGGIILLMFLAIVSFAAGVTLLGGHRPDVPDPSIDRDAGGDGCDVAAEAADS